MSFDLVVIEKRKHDRHDENLKPPGAPILIEKVDKKRKETKERNQKESYDIPSIGLIHFTYVQQNWFRSMTILLLLSRSLQQIPNK